MEVLILVGAECWLAALVGAQKPFGPRPRSLFRLRCGFPFATLRDQRRAKTSPKRLAELRTALHSHCPISPQSRLRCSAAPYRPSPLTRNPVRCHHERARKWCCL